MEYMKDLVQRKNIRLKDYDYSQNGAYFITICIKDRHELLGKAVGAAIGRPCEIELSDNGKIVENAIENIQIKYKYVFVDKYIIMPNHIHMILIIDNNGRAMRAPTISTVINQFKGYATKQIGFPIWQKLFYEHIIRDKEDYQIKWNYIDTNPEKWMEDELCPSD
jgi:hypothetical protein